MKSHQVGSKLTVLIYLHLYGVTKCIIDIGMVSIIIDKHHIINSVCQLGILTNSVITN